MALNTKRQGGVWADNSSPEYGLFVGPVGGRGKAGIQCHAPKWGYLFTSDPDGTPNLLNVVEFLEANSEDFYGIETEADKFVAAYLKWKERRLAA